MSHYFLLNFIQRFSFLQQYLIILSISFILLLIFNHWWYILLLPLSTIFANFSIKRLCHSNQSPYKFSGYIYNLLIRKRSYKQDDNIKETIDIYNSYETTIHKEYDTYIRTIIARYICVWYYPLISTDQEFPEDLMIIFHIILNRLNDQLKLLKSYDIIRLIINLKQQHMKEYLRAYDSYRKQRKPNRLSKSLVEEFSQINSLHRSLINNDIHIYLKALVELLLTNLIPEPVQIYSGSRTGREFLTQIIVNCIFLPLFNQFSKPRMIYYLIILLWETEEQKKSFEINENSLKKQLETNTNQNENEPIIITENLTNQQNHDDEHRSTRLEHIIYSATIISSDTAYDSMFGAAYTVYLIQCETKSPFTSDATHRYTVPRRFREFINLHKRLQQNHITSRHCYDIDEVFRTLPTPIDNMNPDVIRRRKHILEQYIQKLISNEVLNCSHDVLEFFAFNSDPNIPFGILPSKLSVPRVDRVLLRTLSDMGNRLNRLRSTKREMAPLHETFQLNISTTYENSTNATWIDEGESPTTIVRRSKFEPKNLFCIFFKSNGPALIHGVDEGKTIDHNYYIENCLKPVVKEIWKQRKSAGTKGIKLLHDNAGPHRHSDAINYLAEERINIMPHPPYSSDLASCDYWLNDYIKYNLSDQPNEKSLARAVSKVVKNIPEEFKNTFDKLLKRMELCINNHGDYFEHLIK
ncbi:unnamed protein product [Rotaria sp. Silwood1]|nr:unnamed protein product [Rotaria sp. Silwood1]